MLSIIILSYRNPALLRLCLKSLASALANTSMDYEVIVVDSATTIETRHVVTDEFAGQFAAMRVIPIKENTGYTRGVNEGIRAAKGEYILALNYDIVAVPGSLEKLVASMREHPEVGLIGPELLNFNGTHQDSYFRFYSPLTIFYRRIEHLPFAGRMLGRFLMHDADPNQLQKPDWISGAAYMTSRTALARVGMLDERFFHYFSDVDWAQRFWDNGYQVVYEPGSKLYHYLGRTSKGKGVLWDILFNKTTRWHIMDFLRYLRKYGILNSHRSRSLVNAHATTH